MEKVGDLQTERLRKLDFIPDPSMDTTFAVGPECSIPLFLLVHYWNIRSGLEGSVDGGQG